MIPFNFGEAELWILSLLLVILLFAWLRATKLYRRLRNQVVDTKLQEAVIYPSRMAAQRSLQIFATLSITIILLLVLAAVRPQAGLTVIQLPQLTSSLAICLDSSASMRAEDYSPSRFEHAKRKVLTLLSQLRGERVALVSFSGVPFVESPLTDDYRSLQDIASSLKPHNLPAAGSDLAAALEAVIALFPKVLDKRQEDRAVLLISDGEMTAGDLTPVIEKLRNARIRVHALAVATKSGAPIPIPGVRSGGFKTDRQGEIVISKLNLAALQKLTESTGGKTIIASTNDQDLRGIYADIVGSEIRVSRTSRRSVQVWNEYYQLPLFLALLLIIFERLVARKRTKDIMLVVLMAIAVYSPAPVLADSSVEKIGRIAQELFDSGRFEEALVQYRLGKTLAANDTRFSDGEAASLLRLGNSKDAERIYRELAQAETNPERKSHFDFQAGVAAFRGGRLSDAKAYFEQSLKETPNDKESLANLAFIEKLLQNDSSSSQSRHSSSSDSPSPSLGSSSSETEATQSSSSSAGSPSGDGETASAGSEGSDNSQPDSASGSTGSQQNEKSDSGGDQQSAESESWKGGDQPSASSDSAGEMAGQLQYLLDNLEEDPSLKDQFRKEQSMQHLRRKGQLLRPEKDW